jgi:hypothetical protein
MYRVAIVTLALATLGQAADPVPAGPLVAWGTDSFVTSEQPVPGQFRRLAAGGNTQTLAIKEDGTLYLSGGTTIPQVPVEYRSLRFRAVGMGRGHGLAIREDTQEIVSWGLCVPTLGTPPGRFTAVTGGSFHSVGLDVDGRLVLWGGQAVGPCVGQPDLGAGYHAVIGVGAPPGTFKAIAARGRYTLAVGTDGSLYGWGVDTGGAEIVAKIFQSRWFAYGNHYIAPMDPGKPYVDVAAGLDIIVAIREDGSLVTWDTTGTWTAPPAGVFTRAAAALGFAVAIDNTGQLHGWGNGTQPVMVAVPPGAYSDVHAATTHLTAIGAPHLATVTRAHVWVGLKNSDDVGTKFDLRAEVLKDGVIVATGQLAGEPGGSSGFNNARLRTIALSQHQAISLAPGDTLSLRVSVRIAEGVPGHRSGTARLWFNDTSANSRLIATKANVATDYYLVGGTTPSTFALSEGAAGAGPRRTADAFVDRAVGGNPFKPFGMWSIVLQ